MGTGIFGFGAGERDRTERSRTPKMHTRNDTVSMLRLSCCRFFLPPYRFPYIISVPLKIFVITNYLDKKKKQDICDRHVVYLPGL